MIHPSAPDGPSLPCGCNDEGADDLDVRLADFRVELLDQTLRLIADQPCTGPGASGFPTQKKGDLIGRNDTAEVRIPVGADGQVLTADAAQGTGVKWAFAPQGFYGDGSDGDATFSGTMTGDMFFNNLTVGAGTVLDPAGYRLFVKGKLTIEATGAIKSNGDAGSAGVAGGGGAGGGTGVGPSPRPFLDLGEDGGDGGGGGGSGSSNANGGAGGTSFAGKMDLLIHHAGAGGGGGGGHGSAPGAGTAGSDNFGAAGGAGGAGTGAGAANLGGGGGGKGGGVVLIYAREIDNAGSIEAKGGAGGAGEVSGADKGGNGGGGGGGAVILYYTTASGSGVGTLSAAGGAAGTGGNGGSAGASGTTVTYNVAV